MDPTILDQCPSTVTVRRNPHRRARPLTTPATAAAGIPTPSCTTVPKVPFPTEEILSMDISNSKPDPENLRVFLRIRPLLKPSDKRSGVAGDSKARSKNVWPQNPRNAAREQQKKKKSPSAEVCVKVNSARSVTVSPPLALQEPNRLKSEVYDGFSHVFSPDSSQEEVYETMVKPLVEDFLRGKSGMLAAMGPSGSGKTHTVFGCPREPGMVPLALQHIFKRARGSSTESPRSFFISMFEISTEKGKAERWIDLSPNGGEITMQQSNLKGLQEIAISDARQAESLVAQAMQKRATATTNSNSQSSRSQCIINIRGVAHKFDGGDNNKPNEVVLSIVDLAGAEREKRTGNQGARLLESNFINNTSMVFGLCLRSLLEHQKNPKKPMQKHFQNSLLTKYLRDYLEGRKRMSLILTVKSGEEDYRDTSHLLRQASPYMEIKFNNAEDSSNIPNKRHIQTLSRTEHHKRMKLTGSESCMIEQEKSIETEAGATKEVAQRICKSEMSGGPKLCYVDAADGERNHQIMQSFAKTIWNVLKEYNKKLKVANNEIKNLRESLMTEKTRHLELEKELTDIKSCCTCSHIKSNVDQVSYSGRCDNNGRPKRLDSASKEDDKIFSEVQGFGCVDNGPDVNAAMIQSHTDEKQFDATVKTSDVGDDSNPCLGPGNTDHWNHQICEGISGSEHGVEDASEPKCVRIEDSYSNADIAGLLVNSSESVGLHRKDSCSSVELDDLLSEEDEESSDAVYTEHCTSADGSRLDTSSKALQMDKSERRVLPVSSLLPSSNVKNDIGKSKESFDLPASPKEDVVSTKECNITDVPDSEPRVDIPTKPEKPKRRLLPASATLLRNFSTLDPEDDNEKPKGGKKSAAEGRTRTQGSISLVRLLQSNLRI
uniref:armadillo repeat-containing kinesin-like protein 1 n=1 Tax=Fragaria vesca subsp. vesca TaxID=101020 RepID=UPI0005CA9109|nr:PREDICTED: armadillo repeat-containing kinesin-like protein 1 [Fragaria vesca subsp. vesca]